MTASAPEGDAPRYRSALREAQALATRTAVLDAAATCFERSGYGRTTMRAIATEAGVSVETVYAQGSKSALLLTCVDRALAGDDDDVPMTDHAAFARALASPSAADVVEGFVAALAAVGVRAGALVVAFEDAATSDPAVAGLWTAAEQRRRLDYRRLVEAVAATGGLHPPWDVETATDAVWATFTPRMAHTLLDSLGWPVDRVVSWVSTAICALLLPAAERPVP